MIVFLSFILISSSLFSQHFSLISSFGAGQASGGFDSKEFAFTSQIGASYETKSEIIAFSAAIKCEFYNFYEEVDLMVFSMPLGCEIHTRTNPKPYLVVSIAPSYPTQWLMERYFFLTGGLAGGLAYDLKKLTIFAQFEYLADLTAYNRITWHTMVYEVKKYYLKRYYVSFGIKVRL